MADTQASSSSSSSSSADASDIMFDRETMRVFYSRLFPFKQLYNWLSYSHAEPESYFLNREFAFTDMDEIFKRFQCYTNLQDFKQSVTKLCPQRMEIGPVYSYPPKTQGSYGSPIETKERELIFDIDMDDYDAVRRCSCRGKKILCNSCWSFIKIAIQVVDKALDESFGFDQRIWIFSGRRGAHCWVADKRARLMNNATRAAIVNYLLILKKAKHNDQVLTLPLNLHPFFFEIYHRTLLPAFEAEILVAHKVLAPENWDFVLSFIPDEELRNSIRAEWDTQQQTEEQRWSQLKNTVERAIQQGKNKTKFQYKTNPIVNIVFTYTYPRLDDHVSTATNHLLKSPFCVHPGTGNICVPIDTAKLDEFDPTKVPQLRQVLAELDESASDPESKQIEDYKKTSLKPYIKFFNDQFVSVIEKQAITDNRKQEEAKLSF